MTWPKEPFDLLCSSWPRPIVQSGGRWSSQPEWNAPAMSSLPSPEWRSFKGESCWTIDWRRHFRGPTTPEKGIGGEMRGFHVIFRIRVNGAGRLVFWDDDGSIILRNGEEIHEDRRAHAPLRHEIVVRAGDRLDVAQWQHYGDWLWGARLKGTDVLKGGFESLRPYLGRVRERLRHPDGPPLKLFFSGETPVRTAVSVFSMLLNGYRPSELLIFGEHQWSRSSREFFEEIFPFARIIPTEEVLQTLGEPRLSKLAFAHWFVMKACVGLLSPPQEYCFMDDDVFVLDPVEDALEAFGRADLVYGPDWDHTGTYHATWGKVLGTGPSPLGRLNTGLYWLRRKVDPRQVVADLLRAPPRAFPGWVWEQGFMASHLAGMRHHPLSSARYFYPVVDGLPGNVLGYDYASNPCGFATIHYGGISEKPGDGEALVLARDILERRRDPA